MKQLGWIAGIVLLGVVGRAVWLAQAGDIVFESDILALLPKPEDSKLVQEMDARISSKTVNRITVLIQGQGRAQIDAATDHIADLLQDAIDQNKVNAKLVDGIDIDAMSERIDSMLKYRARLIGDRSRQRMEESVALQLRWRIDNVTQFPPSNFTDPVVDPLGTLEEFLIERMPGLAGIKSDGLYLRVDGGKNHLPANLLLIELVGGELGSTQAVNSVEWILGIRDIVDSKFNVELHLSGVPLHAMTIKNKTIMEIRWMALLALVFSLGVFWYVTRSFRALLFSSAAILLAICGGLAISHDTIGLPHLVGLTMATTAIGICIDFSFHFWIYIRTGMSGTDAIKTIFPGINMSFVTTSIGLLVITIVSIPVLARAAIFIFGALLVSWLVVLFVFPHLARNSSANKPRRVWRCDLPKQIALGLLLVIIFVSVIGLVFKYYTDDKPSRIGRMSDSLVQDDKIVNNLLGIPDENGIYLIKAKSPELLLETEEALFESLSLVELDQVQAVSRLVVSEVQQRQNQVLFQEARGKLETGMVENYQTLLGGARLNWNTNANESYTLEWVLDQSWASAEKNYVIACNNTVCASMIHVLGSAVSKLDAACQSIAKCSRISFSERQQAAFGKLRFELAWSLLLAVIAMFVALYFRYKNKAFRMIAVPILAVTSGIAAIAWSGMPVTVFTLAALFPLIGLSIDYVVFASESAKHFDETFLAIFASALTTTVSFGVLAFSGTPAVQFFAIPVAVGIPVAWISMYVFKPDYA